MHKIFIDGEHGTTGLQIHHRLKNFKNINLLSLETDNYKNLQARVDKANEADIIILCLPDDAAKEIVGHLYNKSKTRIIDCSTAFRTNETWVYGFAELTKGQDKLIKHAKYVSNPGCYPTGALSLIRPLIDHNVLTKDALLTIHAVSGYSGGGKALINQMTNKNDENYIASNFFSYGLHLKHKHNLEIQKYSKLNFAPVFLPNVAQFAQGMVVNIGLHFNALNGNYNVQDIIEIFKTHYYQKKHISIAENDEVENIQKIEPEKFAGSDDLKIYIFSNAENKTLSLFAVFDNLGKGASGAAVQNLELMLQA